MGEVTSWVGNGNLPGSMGRVSATWPFVILSLTTNQATLHLRPRWLARMAGVPQPRTFAVDQSTAVFPARSHLKVGLGKGLGVGFQRDNDPPWYFLPRRAAQRPDLLAQLADAGFQVEKDERKIKHVDT